MHNIQQINECESNFHIFSFSLLWCAQIETKKKKTPKKIKNRIIQIATGPKLIQNYTEIRFQYKAQRTNGWKIITHKCTVWESSERDL